MICSMDEMTCCATGGDMAVAYLEEVGGACINKVSFVVTCNEEISEAELAATRIRLFVDVKQCDVQEAVILE